MTEDNNKPKKFFGLEVSDSLKYAVVVVLAIILLIQVIGLF